MTRRSFLRQLAWSASALVALGASAGCASFATAAAPTATPTEEALGRGGLVSLAAESSPAARPTALPPDPTAAPPDPTPVPPPTTTPVPAATAVPSPTPIPAPRQPNVLLVTVDTLRSDRVGAYGFAKAHTPTLDRLAAEGVHFDRVVCQLPQTDPSHVSLMTGLYASTNGVKVHMVDKLAPGSQTLATVFAGAGYQTAGIYSWVSLDAQFCGLNQGFQTYDGYVTNRSVLFSDPRLEGLMALYRQVKANVPVVRTVDVAFSGSDEIEKSLDGRADITTPPVLQWLDQHAGGADPFFLWVHYYDPHYPYAPPAGFDHVLGLSYQGKIDGSIDTLHAIESGQIVPTAADIARLEELYQGEIAFMDSQLQQVFDWLQQRGIFDDTIVVLTGDHGESFGEHDDWMHGLKVFETEIHVPLLLRYPRRVPPGQTAAWPVQLIDVMPTLLDLAGIKPKKEIQGASFAPLITGKATKQSPKSRVGFTELADESFVSLVTTEWKLIRNDANGDLQLYHISQDDAELRNLVDDQPQTARELNARIQDVMKYAGVSK